MDVESSMPHGGPTPPWLSTTHAIQLPHAPGILRLHTLPSHSSLALVSRPNNVPTQHPSDRIVAVSDNPACVPRTCLLSGIPVGLGPLSRHYRPPRRVPHRPGVNYYMPCRLSHRPELLNPHTPSLHNSLPHVSSSQEVPGRPFD